MAGAAKPYPGAIEASYSFVGGTLHEGNVKYVVDFTTNNTCQLKLLEPGSYKINY